jgi:serine protease inhibitor
MAWFRTRAPNGDRAGVSRCLEGDHAGHIREVPQEENSLIMYIIGSRDNRKEESQFTDHILQALLRKLTVQEVAIVQLPMYARTYLQQQISSCLFPSLYSVSCNTRCLFFHRLKINHESHEFILEPGTVANSNTFSSLHSEWSSMAIICTLIERQYVRRFLKFHLFVQILCSTYSAARY